MGDMSNWMYDPLGRLHICIGGQLSILMLIEELELAGFHCFMSNTDGASFKVEKARKHIFDQICDEWSKKTTYSLEYANFKAIYFRDVNNYIAITTDGKIKKKGIFLTSTELHKNKSFRIIPLALEQYFINGISPEEYIMKHNNIFDFVGRSTAGKGKFYHKNIKTGDVLPALIRYYPSSAKYPEAIRVMKMKDPKNPSKATNNNIEPADLPKVLCNYLPPSSYNHHLEQVNRQFFIDECYKIIKPIELGRKIKKTNIVPPEQLSLF